MVLFPNCKINLGLRILGKRADGYHNLDTVFYPVPLRDAAEINISTSVKKEQQEAFELSASGLEVPGEVTTNLCHRAWKLLKNDFPDMPALKMHLLKAIPPGAGLGGGSSNGAFTLVLINQLLQLKLSPVQLIAYALQLGSDCPFFVVNEPCHATGRGEVLEKIKLSLDDYHLMLVHPGIHISTGWGFSALSGREKHGNDGPALADIVKQPPEDWKDVLVNDFEQPVFEKFPLMKKIKDELYGAGAAYASMTGTGSCVYGIFHKSRPAENLTIDETCKVYAINQML